MNIKSQVGKRIRELRIKKDLTQEELSFEVGLDRTYIASVENGKRNISVLNLEKFWIFFELTPCEFFNSKVFKEK